MKQVLIAAAVTVISPMMMYLLGRLWFVFAEKVEDFVASLILCIFTGFAFVFFTITTLFGFVGVIALLLR